MLYLILFADATKTGNGEWGMGNGEWGMGNGEWEIENGKIKNSKNWKKYELVILYK